MSSFNTETSAVNFEVRYGTLQNTSTTRKQPRPARVLTLIAWSTTENNQEKKVAKFIEILPIRASASKVAQGEYLYTLKRGDENKANLKTLTLEKISEAHIKEGTPNPECATYAISEDGSKIDFVLKGAVISTITFLKTKKGEFISANLGMVNFAHLQYRDVPAAQKQVFTGLKAAAKGLAEAAKLATSKRAPTLDMDEASAILSSDSPYVKVNGCRCKLLGVNAGVVSDRKGGTKPVINFLCAYTVNGVQIPFNTTRAYKIEAGAQLAEYKPKTAPLGFHLSKLVQFATGLAKFSTELNRKTSTNHAVAVEIAKKLVEAGLMVQERKVGKKTTTFRYTTNSSDPRCSIERKVGRDGKCFLVAAKEACGVIESIGSLFIAVSETSCGKEFLSRAC